MTRPYPLRKHRRYALCLECLEQRTLPATIFTVTNTNDSGANSLRAAITGANNTGNSGAPDEIHFNIPGAGVKTINLLTALPDITEAVILNGFTQPGASANTNPTGNNAVILIELNGAATAADGNGLTLLSSGNTVKGLAIMNFPGSLADGIQIDGDNNTIEGCYLGTDAAGNTDQGNGGTGLRINGNASNTIGGTTPEARNVISGNRIGLQIEDLGGFSNVVQGNFIGTNAAGTAPLGNERIGLFIGFDAHDNTIGGTTAAAANVIAGNGDLANFILAPGVELDGADTANNIVAGNFIGTDLTGTLDLGNTGPGVLVDDGAHDNTIGGIVAGAGNLIRFNFLDGVVVDNGSVNNAILGNSIFNNGRAIDLSDDGDTDNDAGDADAGENNLQNHPILFGAVQGSTRVNGTLNSTPNTQFRIEFFSTDPEETDVFFRGQGQTFLGFLDVTTDASGNVDFEADLPPDTPVGHFIAATATDPDGNTSEFSFSVRMSAPGTAFKLVDNLTTSIFDVFSLHVHGTDGNDTIVVTPVGTSTRNFRVKLNGALLGTFKNIANRIYVFGHRGDDTIILNGKVARPGFLFGGDGNDLLTGARKSDQLRGEAGDDRLTGKQGADLLSGGVDADTLRETGAGSFLLTDTSLTRGAVADALTGLERAILIGSALKNRLDAAGFSGRTTLDGGAGNDLLFGASGADVLKGGPGNDQLSGNGGRDFLIGGAGADQLNGGADQDLLFNGNLAFAVVGAAFASVQAEWERQDIAFADIVTHLKNGGGLNGTNLLEATTVLKDAQPDALTGGSQLDWFFALQPQDSIADPEAGEQVN
jgi:Ca2+-binding RTX toxin-like protein